MLAEIFQAALVSALAEQEDVLYRGFYTLTIRLLICGFKQICPTIQGRIYASQVGLKYYRDLYVPKTYSVEDYQEYHQRFTQRLKKSALPFCWRRIQMFW